MALFIFQKFNRTAWVFQSIHRVSKRKVYTSGKVSTSERKEMLTRKLTEDDIPDVIELRKSNEFQDAVTCYSMICKLQPNAFVVSDDGYGKVIGIFSLFHNNDSVCTAGFRTIHKDYRNLRFSSPKLVPKMFEMAENKSIIGHSERHLINWTMKHLPVLENDFFIYEYETPEDVNTQNLSCSVPEDVQIEEFKKSHLQLIFKYDQSIIKYQRESLVSLNCENAFCKTFTAIKLGKCVGYGCIKLNIQGCSKLGPLYADDPLIAEALLKNLLSSFKLGKGFASTALSNNAAAVMLMEKLGEMKKLIVYRCYSKKISVPETKRIYSTFDIEIEPF